MILKDSSLKHKSVLVLEFAGFKVIQCDTSRKAIDILRSHNIDLVITEVNIGDIDGWKLSRFIRTGILASSENLPILLITENHSERIAETTAHLFDINKVISFQELNILADVVVQVIEQKDTIKKLPSLLVIEDTEDTANLVYRMLKHKFDITLALDGIKGVKAFRQNAFDIVLLDIMMPGMSGDEVLDILMELNPKQVVIAMTAHGTIDLAELMLVKGASDYIQKPFKAEQLRKVCDIAVKREDFLVANQQFSAKSVALENEQEKYDSLAKTHYRVLDSLNTIVIEINLNGRISFVNQAWYQFTGYTVSEVIGKPFIQFIHDKDPKAKQYVEEAFVQLLSGKSSLKNIEVPILKDDGFFWSEVNLSPYFNDEKELFGVSGTIDDISLRKKSEEHLTHVALHDNLTELYNRYHFDGELKKAASTSVRAGCEHSLLYIDLDHFKVINDSQGHHQGDLVLKEIAHLLSQRTRESDLLCRIGGDEFSLLLTNSTVSDAEILAEEICQIIANTSFCFSDQVYKVSCSIGISAINGKEATSDIYLQQADIAMFAAKSKGRNGFHVFTPDDHITGELKQSFEWAQKLQKALVEDNIVIHFQPILCLKTRTIAGYEALVRLMVDDEMIFPNDFIPFLEKAEEMNSLDRHVIDKALRLMAENKAIKKLAINLSAQAFTDERLFDVIAENITQYNIEPSHVVFELTESASLSNLSATQRLVARLNTLGCRLSIDDFGTGFSTFSYLKQIPASTVKIDGSFVKDMIKNKVDEVLVKSINDTAHALGKRTVAEFVEDEATLEKLAELGVDYGQGYYIGRPMAIERINQPTNTALKSS